MSSGDGIAEENKELAHGSRRGRPVDADKRDSILEAATDSFFENGFAATSIEQVAALAGVSKVTVYNHFGDKRGLFTESVDAQCAKMRGHFTLAEMPHGTLRERLLAIGEAVDAFLSRPEMVQFERRIAAETEHDPQIGEAFLNAGPYRMKTAFAAFLQALDAAGEVKVGDTTLAAEQFVSMCKGMGDLERRFGRPNDPKRNRERIEGAVDVFLHFYAR
ncbi:TetR/AcrR family transcriptional regulator [Altererythrobacter sp. MF3-039]|uniref:TetR/AcrR family transcriptional regulator n=1 Tax=Altererythrobacter sp. MF3-039 TaxID=3252901 RepID=UPI00390C7C80